MNRTDSFTIQKKEFNSNIYDQLEAYHYAKDLWPIVYIISDNKIKEAYVGETSDTFNRMETHLKNNAKNKLTTLHLIGSQIFNKSATLDIESNLIKYMSGDGKFQLMNATLGIANHNYYQKNEVYWGIFKSIWDELRSKGVAQHSLEYINNSDLFKYSPYKSLRKEQIEALKDMLYVILDGNYETAVMEGGAGTGKTILAIFLFKLLVTDIEDFNFREFGDQEFEFIELVNRIKEKFSNPKIGFVVPMSSFRDTLKKVFKNIKGLKSGMVIGPAEVTREKYDIIVVDESHRLRKKKSIGAYIGAFNNAAKRLGLNPEETDELEWITLQSKKTILFYDKQQSIKPSDVNQEHFDELKKRKTTTVKQLKSQFRVLGGNDYVEFIDKLLSCELTETDKKFNSKVYEFLLFDTVDDLISEIKSRDKESGLARTVAGFSWEWISNKKGKEHIKDIKIGDVELKWNGTAKDWINSENAINEVGCIHTTQGYDLNYAGIIFGNEISYDKEKNEIVINKENYKDSTGRRADTPEQLKEYILNIYKTMMLRGIKGTYLYACDPNLREYLSRFVPMKSEKNPISKIEILPADEVEPYVNAMPVYHHNIAAGAFEESQQVAHMDWVKPPEALQLSKEHFACRVVGESMNKIIPNGSYAVFKKYYGGGSFNGQIVLVEHTDLHHNNFGSNYTIKEYQSQVYQDEYGQNHESIVLSPISTDEKYKDIILSDDDLSNNRIIGVFECLL